MNFRPCLALLAAGLLLCGKTSIAQVRITEFMASNTSTLADEDGDFSDWIELQNTATNSVSLATQPTMSVVDTAVPASTNRFYRITLNP